MLNINKRLRPIDWISLKTWKTLKKKEKAYLIYKYNKKKYSKKDYMDLLFLEDNCSYWRFIKRLNQKLKSDLLKKSI